MAAVPDVRVRLSAEGLEEIVKTFRQIQAEAERTGRSGGLAARRLNVLSGSLSGLTALLPALSAAAAVAGLISLTKNALSTADALGKLQQKTGFTVETLSVLSFAARTADLEQEQLAFALANVSRVLDDYDKGARSARDATQQLFGNRRALEGLPDDQRLLKIVDALAKLEPGAKRTGLAIDFFGKRGEALLPLIDDLGEGGFEELRKKMQRLGLSFDQDLVEGARRANDAMKDLNSTAQGMATQFASGLAPAIADVADALVDAAAGDGVNAFREIGEFAGKVLRGIVVGIDLVVVALLELGGKAGVAVRAAFESNLNFFRVGPREALLIFKRTIDSEFKQIDDNIAAHTQNLLTRINFEGDRRPARRPPGGGDDRSKDLEAGRRNLEAQRKLADARLALAQAQLNSELALTRAKNALILDEEKRRFDQGLVEVQQYFANRLRIIEQESDEELRLMDSKIAAQQERLKLEQTRPRAEKESEADRRAKELAIEKEIEELQSQRDLSEISRRKQIAALTGEQLDLQRRVTQEQLQAEAQIAEAQGRRFEAARLELEAQIAALQRLKGESEAAFGERKRILFDAGLQKIEFDKIQTDAEQLLKNLAAERQAILDEQASGRLFQVEASEKILALERQRLPLLRQIAAAMQAAAITPEQIEKAREFAEAVNQVAIATDTAGLRMADLKRSFQEAAESELADFLGNLQNRVHSVGDAFRELALSVAQAIQQIIAQMLAAIIVAQILKALIGVFGGGGGSSAGAGSAGGGEGIGGGGFFASGGPVRGPGTGTSDSIVARVSTGEFIEPARIVRHYGQDVFELLRQKKLPRKELRELAQLRAGLRSFYKPRTLLQPGDMRSFAEGGLVADGDGFAAGRGRGGGIAGAELSIGLDPELILKKLEASPEFRRVLVRTTEANAKAMRAALGGQYL